MDVSLSAQAAMIKHDRLSDLNSRNVFCYSSGGWEV